MGQTHPTPKQDRINPENETYEINGVEYNVAAVGIQGFRHTMEDSHTIKKHMKGHQGWSFFAVFDGHAGNAAAEFCKTALIDEVEEKMKGISDMDYKEKEIKAAIRESFIETDSKLRTSFGENDNMAGATCVAVIITQKDYIFINCGDSRAILSRKKDLLDTDKEEVTFATQDQKPTMHEERLRIQKANGYVQQGRVNGTLAVSRSFGDFEYKEDNGDHDCQKVSVIPEVDIIPRDDKEDMFVALCCDGVFDVFPNYQLALFINNQFKLKEDLLEIAGAVCDTALFKGSGDNISVCIIKLPLTPAVEPKRQEVEKKMESLFDEVLEEMNDEQPLWQQRRSNICRNMAYHEKIEPLMYIFEGGGIAAKQKMIIDILDAKYSQPETNEEGVVRMGPKQQ